MSPREVHDYCALMVRDTDCILGLLESLYMILSCQGAFLENIKIPFQAPNSSDSSDIMGILLVAKPVARRQGLGDRGYDGSISGQLENHQMGNVEEA